jgi:hypothetical protein
MQTGANAVFVLPTGGKGPLAAATKAGMVYRRARNSDIESFAIEDKGPRLLYLEDARSFSSLPAEIKKHLSGHKATLTARKAYERGDCEWWRYTWPLHKEYFDRDRIYVPYRAHHNRFAVDAGGNLLGITGTTVLYMDNQPEDLYYLAARLNSKVLTYRFKFIGKLVGVGHTSTFATVWRNYPFLGSRKGTRTTIRLLPWREKSQRTRRSCAVRGFQRSRKRFSGV